MSEDAYMKIMVPVDSQAEIDSALKKYAGVDQLDCAKEGYCILQGPQEALEGILETLGYEDSIKEFVCPDCGKEIECPNCEADEQDENDESDEEDESDECNESQVVVGEADEQDENDESDEEDESDENDESDEEDENDESDEDDEDDEDDEEDESCCESYATTEALRTIVANRATLRMEAVKETLDHQFMETTLFESMEEDQAKKMKEVVAEAVDSILEKACVSVVSDVTKLFESYVNKQIIPAIDSYVQKEVVPSIVAKLDENVDGYLQFVGEELSKEMLEEGMIVQSPKSEILESFTGELLELIESKLQVVPEREDALIKAKESISKLTESLQEVKMDNLKVKKALIEAKRENYVVKHMPEDISEAQKETLTNYASEVLSECTTMSEFRKGFNKACREIREYSDEPMQTVFKPEPAPKTETIGEMLFRMGRNA